MPGQTHTHDSWPTNQGLAPLRVALRGRCYQSKIDTEMTSWKFFWYYREIWLVFVIKDEQMSNYSFIMRKYHIILQDWWDILGFWQNYFFTIEIAPPCFSCDWVTENFSFAGGFAAVLLLTLYCWLVLVAGIMLELWPASTKRTESHSVLVRDVLVKHRVIVGTS